MIAKAIRTSLDHCATPGIATTLTRAVAVYVAAGAIAKIIWGSPADLPTVVQALFTSNPDGGFLLVVAIEVIAAVVAFTAPRAGWPFLVALLTAFLGVLSFQLSLGERDCGCFGAIATVPTWLMLLMDAAAVAALFAVRPWRTLRTTPWRPWSFAVAAIAVVGAIGYLAAPVARVGAAPPETVSAAATPTTPAPVASTWTPPASLPRFAALRPQHWEGQRLAATDLATFVDTSRFPRTARLIIYYQTCGHCARLLRDLAAAPGETPYVLVQVPTPPDSVHPKRVDAMPDGLHVLLPAEVKWSVRTPWDIKIEDGIVVSAKQE
jgi:hypothetical protein